MNTLLTALLRIVLVILMLGALLFQALVPVAAGEAAREYPEFAHLEVPYSVLTIAAVACGEVVLVIVWRLLSMVASGAIFNRGALRWVDGMTLALGLATALVAGTAVHLIGIEQTGGPVLALGLLGATVIGIAAVLTLVVLRGLLVSAVAHHDELAEVI